MNNNKSSIKSETELKDISNDITIENFAKENDLQTQCLKSTKSDMIVLPNNKRLPKELRNNKNVYSPLFKEVLDTFNDEDVKTQLYDDGRDKKELVLKSGEEILPILYFVGEYALHIGLAILGNWIYDRWVKGDSQQTLTFEYAVMYDDNKTIHRRKIECSPTEVIRLLDEDVNRLNINDSSQED